MHCFKLNSVTRLCRSRYSLAGISNEVFCSTKTKSNETPRKLPPNVPDLREFLIVNRDLSLKTNLAAQVRPDIPAYLEKSDFSGLNRKVFFEVYGCQMNVSDTEIVWAILKENQYQKCEDAKDADVILLVTCAIRDGAEQKIWHRLKHLNALKTKRSKKKSPLQIAVLGCMAERLKTQLLEKEQWVDVVAGPDSYKDLPRLLSLTSHYGQSAVNVILSADETYADIMPVRLNTEAPTSFVSIMRGCDNMCTYCIVPFTRGRERSRPVSSILEEIKKLEENGIKEVTLLGQNVNSYRDLSQSSVLHEQNNLVPGFKTVYKPKQGGLRFGELLQQVAEAVPEVRIRFTSPHPKDFPDSVLEAIKKYPNICENIHLPAQSGNSNVLERMRRGYTREVYIDLVKHIRSTLPNVALSSDFICGFCGETDAEFEDTITLIEQIKYNVAYVFAYSMREKTTAHRRFVDDVPQQIKMERVQRMMNAYRKGSAELHSRMVGQNQLILIEAKSKRSDAEWFGRNDANIKVIIKDCDLPASSVGDGEKKPIASGDFIAVKVVDSNSQVLKGNPLHHTTIQKYHESYTTDRSSSCT
ncbi:CDK5RAP1-like protein [Eupeodes corollae]|uniref:CDK5RAP1-like protein n=1 Tax=Eupeodes corollae TaxID=290404 RepID=UPI00248F727D|nr:CDK5RAP1-like protein [Eupeodes corollae]